MTIVHRLCAVFCALVFCLIARPALAFPNVDGLINPGEYQIAITDDAAEGLYEGNLDIDSVYFFRDNVAVHLGLTVVDGPISQNGSSGSLLGQTILFSLFYADEALTQPLYRIITNIQDGFSALLLQAHNGVNWSTVGLGGQYLLDVDAGVELAVPAWAMANLPDSFYYVGMLDDSGPYPDDMIAAFIPEPASVSLLALGALAMVRRRRA